VRVVSDDVEREISEGAYGRRTFLRRLAVGSAFAVPVVSSFSMAGIQAVSAHADQSNGLIGNCNSTTTVWTSNSSYGPRPTIGCSNQHFESAAQEIFEIIRRIHHI
jgi:hypothetical protein